MALEFTVKTLDGLDESLHGLYKQDGDAFRLDVAGVVPESEVADIRQRNLDLTEEAARRRKANERWKALGESPEEVAEKLKGKPNADQEKIIADLRNEYEAKLNGANERLVNMTKKSALDGLAAEFAKADIIAAGIQPLTVMARDRVKVDSEGNLRIMSEDGSKPIAGSGADGYATLADLAKELAAGETGQLFVKDAGSSGGGKPPASGAGKPAPVTVKRSQFDAMSHKERADFSKSGGKVTD